MATAGEVLGILNSIGDMIAEMDGTVTEMKKVYARWKPQADDLDKGFSRLRAIIGEHDKIEEEVKKLEAVKTEILKNFSTFGSAIESLHK
jgi:hypothetical protein